MSDTTPDPNRPVTPPEFRRKSHNQYDPAACQYIVDWMGQGCSVKECCAMLGISELTMRRWRKAHEEFAEAYRFGRMLRQAWWERLGREGTALSRFNHQHWSNVMQMQFGQSLRRSMDVKSNRTSTHKLDADSDRKLQDELSRIIAGRMTGAGKN